MFWHVTNSQAVSQRPGGAPCSRIGLHPLHFVSPEVRRCGVCSKQPWRRRTGSQRGAAHPAASCDGMSQGVSSTPPATAASQARRHASGGERNRSSACAQHHVSGSTHGCWSFVSESFDMVCRLSAFVARHCSKHNPSCVQLVQHAAEVHSLRPCRHVCTVWNPATTALPYATS